MKEQSTTEEISTDSCTEKELKPEAKNSSCASIILILKFHLNSGKILTKYAKVARHEKDQFQETIVKQVCQGGNKWFFFVESKNPHPIKSTLFNIPDILALEIEELPMSDFDMENRQ